MVSLLEDFQSGDVSSPVVPEGVPHSFLRHTTNVPLFYTPTNLNMYYKHEKLILCNTTNTTSKKLTQTHQSRVLHEVDLVPRANVLPHRLDCVYRTSAIRTCKDTGVVRAPMSHHKMVTRPHYNISGVLHTHNALPQFSVVSVTRSVLTLRHHEEVLVIQNFLYTTV
jgi:hypothetical protein